MAIWSNLNISPLCQFYSSVVILLAVQHKYMIEGRFLLKRMCVSIICVFWNVTKCVMNQSYIVSISVD